MFRCLCSLCCTKNIPELNCDAIPETSLSPEYINKWNTWNGNELPDQIIAGVDQLYQTCKLQKNNFSSENEHLRKLYRNMKKNIN